LNPHQIGIWTAQSQSQIPLATTTVPAGTSAPLQGHFRYAALATPLILTPGTTCLIGGFDQGGTDPHGWDALVPLFPGFEVIGFIVAGDINVGAAGTARGVATANFSFPTLTTGGARRAVIGPNFLYETTSAPEAPVPEAGTMLGAGTTIWAMLVLMRRRRSVEVR